jgi:hypothetical protein
MAVTRYAAPVLFLAMACASCMSVSKRAEDTVVGHIDVVRSAAYHRVTHGRWPADRDELRRAASAVGVRLTPVWAREAELRPQPDDTLLMSVPPGDGVEPFSIRLTMTSTGKVAVEFQTE